jgi:hypothetical protein
MASSDLAFRVYGLPRSGTSWASVWLSQWPLVCLHDPCEHMGWEEIEVWAQACREDGKLPGISCTGMWMHPDHDPSVPTLRLERPLVEIDLSLCRLGVPRLPRAMVERFNALPYPMLAWTDLFDSKRAWKVWKALLGERLPFDADWHRRLRQLRIVPSDETIERLKRTLRRGEWAVAD